MLQNNYDNLDFERLKTNFNLNMINLASLQTDFITSLPKELNKISLLTDKISNLNIISGNCYLYKKGSDLELISSDNVIFDKVFNTFKLKPTFSSSCLFTVLNLNKGVLTTPLKIISSDYDF